MKSYKQKINNKYAFHEISGFSLIEVMIVVVIIGILATLVYPKVERHLSVARQTEAKSNLKAIFDAQKLYHSSYRTYSNDLQKIGVTWEEGDDPIYQYSITSANETSFEAKAEGNIDNDETTDIWTINEKKALENISNDMDD